MATDQEPGLTVGALIEVPRRRAVDGHARAAAGQQHIDARRCQCLEIDQLGEQHHRREVLGHVEHAAGLVEQLGRRGGHDLDDAHHERGRIQQEADVVVAPLDHDAAGPRVLGGDGRQLRRHAGVDLGPLDEHGLVRECEHRHLDGRSEERAVEIRVGARRLGQHDLDQRVRIAVPGHDEAGPPVALPAEEVGGQIRPVRRMSTSASDTWRYALGTTLGMTLVRTGA